MAKPFKISPFTATLTSASISTFDLVVVGVAEGQLKEVLAQFDRPLSAYLAEAAQSECFNGSARSCLMLRQARADNKANKGPVTRIALVGVGSNKEHGPEHCLRLGGTATRLAQSSHASSLLLVPAPHDVSEHCASALVQGLRLGNYCFDTYLSKTTNKSASAAKSKATITSAQVVLSGGSKAAAAAIVTGEAIAKHVALARDLVNTPPNDLYPASFANKIKALAKAAKLGCKILDPTQLKARNMGLLLGVGQGSDRSPRLVHLTYKGGGKGLAKVALVGKGITFDSGGLSLKPSDGMMGMKMDMGGAAVVLSTLLSAQALGLDGEIHAVMALAENMPSGTAIRPGDILTSAQGTTVEVNNTDAEGRLVLADALHYIRKEAQPDQIIDVATLTGACMVALGQKTVGLFSNDDHLAAGLLAAATCAGEDFWRMPLTQSLKDQLKSDCADMRNTGERYGGAITAALFLQRFIGEAKWAHLDIAGPATGTEDAAHLRKGGTGVAVSTLVHWLRQRGQRG